MNISIIGLGLIGGSLGLRIKEKTQHTVIGFSRSIQTRQKALDLKTVDTVPETIVEQVLGELEVKIMEMTPQQHDECVGLISHFPALLSAIVVNVASQNPNWSDAQKIASTGFRDTSRLASTPTWLMMDFCREN